MRIPLTSKKHNALLALIAILSLAAVTSAQENSTPNVKIKNFGQMDDRFYILVNGRCLVERHGKTLGAIESGDCFGETSYVRGARRTATIKAETPVSVLRVSSTLLDTVAPAGTVTEAFAVTVMAVVSGIASGNAAGGAIVDAASWEVAVACSGAAALAAAAAALARHDSLTARSAPAVR